MKKKIATLTDQAKKRMEKCHDPIHDLNHVKRVVGYTRHIANDLNLSEKQLDALLLAAWWHDTGRAVTKRPSFIIVAFLDDMFSSMMLWYATIKCRLFGGVVGLSTKVILCKSLGTGAWFTRLLLGKRDRVLVDILSDADKLDMLNTERTQKIYAFVEESKMYKATYRIAVWWWFNSGHLKLKTDQAKEYLKELLQAFIIWLQQSDAYDWHIHQFGEAWMERFLIKLDMYYARAVATSSKS